MPFLNLTDTNLPVHHRDILNLGSNLVPALQKVPIMNIVTSVEMIASNMKEGTQQIGEAEKLRREVSNALDEYVDKKLPTNLSRQQNQALYELKNDDNIKIVPFDKGTGFALLSSGEMFRKIEEQLGEAKEIEKDPTKNLVTKFQKEISKLKKEDKIDKTEFYSMYPSDAIPPRLYGLVKAHKMSKGYPMRTVVSTIGTPFYGTSKHLVQLIQPTLNKNEIRVVNSASFVEEAKGWEIAEDEVQVSFDVVALYPSVPIKRAIDAISQLLTEDETDLHTRTKLSVADIRKLLELSLGTCYFLWDNKYYLIEDSGPIGLSLMVVVAEGFLQYLENIAIRIAVSKGIAPKSFRRYVDDSHARFQNNQQPSEFLQILNEQDPKIEYTMESEIDRELAFLDVNIRNNASGSYEFKIFRKDAITNVQVKPTSSVNPRLCSGIFKGFLARALRICSAQHIDDEIAFLVDVFVQNGHDRMELEKIAHQYIDQWNRPRAPAEREDSRVVKLPWIPKLGPKLRKILRKRNIKTVFTSGTSLKDILCNHKTKLPKNSHPGVYRVDCSCGNAYIGETKKRVASRMTEHQKDIFHGRWKSSGAAFHRKTCTGSFDYDNATTIAIEDNYRRRKIREGLEIRKAGRTGSILVNRDEGTICTTTEWNVLLSKLKS